MRKFLLYSSVLVLGLSGRVAEAACIQTPSCSSLEYTSSSSCTGGTKCPFGNYWNCTASDLNDKITELEKIIEEIKQNSSSGGVSNCQIGDILYSDKTCSADVVNGKTPIGVVFDRANKLAIGLEEAEKTWATEYFDVPWLSNINFSSDAAVDWQGKNNTRLVLEYCEEIGVSCPAFEYVNSYKTEGTYAGDWYLPAFGELSMIYDNKDILNITLGKIKGTQLYTNYYWSSSEISGYNAWVLIFFDGNASKNYKNYNYYVRPVMQY